MQKPSTNSLARIVALALIALLSTSVGAHAFGPSEAQLNWAKQTQERLEQARHPYIQSIETGQTYLFAPHAYVRIQVITDFQGTKTLAVYCKPDQGLRPLSRQALTGHPALAIIDSLCQPTKSPR